MMAVILTRPTVSIPFDRGIKALGEIRPDLDYWAKDALIEQVIEKGEATCYRGSDDEARKINEILNERGIPSRLSV